MAISLEGFKDSTAVSAKTKIDGVEHKHNLMIDWNGLSADAMQRLAQRTIVHMFHTRMRANGVIPDGSVDVKATEYQLGVRVQKVTQTPEQMLAALSPEERAALIAKFIGG